MLALTDRAFALPQRRGVPLPLAISVLPLISPAGMLAMAVFLGEAGFPQFAAAIAVVGFVEAALGLRYLRRLLRDAARWSPDMVRYYRHEALRARGAWGGFRMALLAIGAAATVVVALVALRTAAPVLLAAAVCYLVWAFGLLARSYGSCAMPTEPDASVPSMALPAS